MNLTTPDVLTIISKQEEERRPATGFTLFSVTVTALPGKFLVLSVYQSNMNPREFYTELSLYHQIVRGIIVRERKAPPLFTINPNEVI